MHDIEGEEEFLQFFSAHAHFYRFFARQKILLLAKNIRDLAATHTHFSLLAAAGSGTKERREETSF